MTESSMALTTAPAQPRITVCHNILWSKYKGGVFTALHQLAQSSSVDLTFIQIAETEHDRVGLSGVDMSYHTYPHELLFRGSYADVPILKVTKALLRAVHRSKPSLVIIPGYDRPEYWALLAYCVVSGTKRAVFCDSTAFDRPSSFWKRAAKRLFFKFCNGFFAYGQRARSYLVGLGASPQAVYFRCQAAALPHSYTPEAALEKRMAKRAGVRVSEFVYVGRLSPEKGLDTLLRAFDSFAANVSEASLTLVGAGPEQGALEALRQQLPACNRIRFAGPRSTDAIAEMLAGAVALILPSRSEPWGLVVNEALSYGCPAVVSEVCGCVPELVVAGQTGYSFKTDSEKDLARAIRDVHALVAVDEAGTAKSCIEHMRNFTPQRAAQQILEGSCEILR